MPLWVFVVWHTFCSFDHLSWCGNSHHQIWIRGINCKKHTNIKINQKNNVIKSSFQACCCCYCGYYGYRGCSCCSCYLQENKLNLNYSKRKPHFMQIWWGTVTCHAVLSSQIDQIALKLLHYTAKQLSQIMAFFPSNFYMLEWSMTWYEEMRLRYTYSSRTILALHFWPSKRWF